jgi:hypothetical protein
VVDLSTDLREAPRPTEQRGPQGFEPSHLTAAPATAAGAFLAVNTAIVAMAKAGDVDPIFEAITAHRQYSNEEMACYRVVYRLLERMTERSH